MHEADKTHGVHECVGTERVDVFIVRHGREKKSHPEKVQQGPDNEDGHEDAENTGCTGEAVYPPVDPWQFPECLSVRRDGKNDLQSAHRPSLSLVEKIQQRRW